MSIHVQLERFEGPLGLLLHLIREQEMDIFNINIHQITRQYLEYIKTMRRLDLEVAGEFVAMAATLIHIKSRMLLPQYNEDGEEIPVEDPRKDLVQKLIEYKKFQELSQQLYKLPLLGRDVFRRGERTEIESLDEGELVLDENPLYSLIASYRHAIKNMKKTVHRVAAQMLSIGERIMQMKDLLIPGRRMVFNDLITEKANPATQVLLTFLSLLELAKMGFISVFQSEPFADIHIDPKRTIDRDVISQVENYESVNAEQKAEEIMADAQLSLDEAEGVLPDDEAGDAPVVQESFADAASDEDILAEEMRMANEDQGGVIEDSVQTESPVEEMNSVQTEFRGGDMNSVQTEFRAGEMNSVQTEFSADPNVDVAELSAETDSVYAELTAAEDTNSVQTESHAEATTSPIPSEITAAPSEQSERIDRALADALAAFEQVDEPAIRHDDANSAEPAPQNPSNPKPEVEA